MNEKPNKVVDLGGNIKKGTVLFAANFQYNFREPAMAQALQSFGWVVENFSWRDYVPNSIFGNLQVKYLLGSVTNSINKALIDKCKALNPDVVFLYKAIHIHPQTISEIKQYVRLVVSWNPDNAFGKYNKEFAKRYRPTGIYTVFNSILSYEKTFFFKRLWKRYVKSIPIYDICFVYRKQSISKYQEAGAKEVHHLPSFYVPELHRPMELSEYDRKRFESDVVFIGHYEPDQRIECIEELLNNDVHVRIFGTGWNPYLSQRLRKAFADPILPIYGRDYVNAICASKISLCFLSELNNNPYTRRCFEIPACGGLLLCERTDTMKELYEEDKEAVYFSDKMELVEKARMLLNQPEKRETIARAGHKRCLSSGYDVVSRMRIWDDEVCKKLNIIQKK